MPYAIKPLFDAILAHLREAPRATLGDIALQLHVSRRTVENLIYAMAGKTFRDLRREILLGRVKSILASNPTVSVKELSFAIGFKSPSSFSRAIKHACGSSPEQLRSDAVRATEFLLVN